MTDLNIKIMDFMAQPDVHISNYQRAIVRFRREPELIPIGAYMASMEIIADDAIGTAATDCVRRIWYSPKYFDSLTVDECTAAMIHETQHKFLNFFPRFERWAAQYKGQYSRTYLLRVFNMAQDYFINWMIKHQWNLPLSPTWMYNPDFTPDVHTTESIANLLLASNAKVDGPEGTPAPEGQEEGDDTGDDEDSSGGGGPSEEGEDTDDEETGEGDGEGDGEGEGEDSDGEGDGEGDDSDEQGAGGAGEDDLTDPTDSAAGEGNDIVLPEEYDGDIENELSDNQMHSMNMQNRQDISEALRAAKGYTEGGSTDPFTAVAESAAYETGFDFKSELARHANVANNHGKWSWYRPNRRLRTSQGLALPSRRGKSIGTAVFIIDSSGSTSGSAVRYFLDLTLDALRTVDYKRAVIIWCSDEVPDNGIQEFTKDEAMGWKWDGKIRAAGYGTHLEPAFRVVADEYPDARCITYLTDGGVGTYDVMGAADIIHKELNNIPTLYLLIDECGYSYVERFIDWVNEFRAGRCARLPVEKVKG